MPSYRVLRLSSSSADAKEASQNAMRIIRATYKQRQKKREQAQNKKTKTRTSRMSSTDTPAAPGRFQPYTKPSPISTSSQHSDFSGISDKYDYDSERTSMTTQSDSSLRAKLNNVANAHSHAHKARASSRAPRVIDLSKTPLWQIRRHQKERDIYMKMSDLERTKTSASNGHAKAKASYSSQLELCENSVKRHEAIIRSLWETVRGDKEQARREMFLKARQRAEQNTELAWDNIPKIKSSRRGRANGRYRPY